MLLKNKYKNPFSLLIHCFLGSKNRFDSMSMLFTNKYGYIFVWINNRTWQSGRYAWNPRHTAVFPCYQPQSIFLGKKLFISRQKLVKMTCKTSLKKGNPRKKGSCDLWVKGFKRLNFRARKIYFSSQNF